MKHNNIPSSALTSLVFGNTFGIAETTEEEVGRTKANNGPVSP